MQFQVPQFLETETKIIGPFTLRQFFWIAGGVALIFILNFFLPLTYLILTGIPIAGISLAFAFYKINGAPLINYVMSAINFSISSKQYLFRKDDTIQFQDQQFTKQ